MKKLNIFIVVSIIQIILGICTIVIATMGLNNKLKGLEWLCITSVIICCFFSMVNLAIGVRRLKNK